MRPESAFGVSEEENRLKIVRYYDYVFCRFSDGFSGLIGCWRNGHWGFSEALLKSAGHD